MVSKFIYYLRATCTLQCTQSLSFLLVIERLQRTRCTTTRETGVSEVGSRAENGEEGRESARLCLLVAPVSLNYCGREMKGTACSPPHVRMYEPSETQYCFGHCARTPWTCTCLYTWASWWVSALLTYYRLSQIPDTINLARQASRIPAFPGDKTSPAQEPHQEETMTFVLLPRATSSEHSRRFLIKLHSCCLLFFLVVVIGVVLEHVPGAEAAKQLVDAIRAKKDIEQLQTILSDIPADDPNGTVVLRFTLDH